MKRWSRRDEETWSNFRRYIWIGVLSKYEEVESIAINKFKPSHDKEEGVPPDAIRGIMVVVTFWYRAPELLLEAKHYTSAIDIWAVGCIFAELLTLEPLFPGSHVDGTAYPFQVHQLDKIFEVLGHPTLEKWPTLMDLPHWESDTEHIQGHKYDNAALYNVVHLLPTDPTYDLLSRMLEYDPSKRIRASQALEHEYFRMEPLSGWNTLVSPEPGEEVVNYPIREVDPSTHI